MSGAGGQPAAHELLGTIYDKLQRAVMHGEGSLGQLVGADSPARPPENPPSNFRSLLHVIDELATRNLAIAEATAAECSRQDAAQVAARPGYPVR